jgi:hypothetical protein
LFLHGFQRVENSLIGARDDQFADLSGVMFFCADNFAGSDFYGGVYVAALAHPLVVVDLAEIAHAGVGKEGDDERFRVEIFRKAQRRGDTAATGTPGEQAFHFDQAAGNDEALVVVDLQDVVENLEVHGGGEEIFTDTFYDVALGFHLFAAFHEIVVERAQRIDADDLDLGIFFLEILADAADGAASAHAADKVSDFTFGIIPDFRAGGQVVGLRIHGVVVLIGIIGVGNFA